MINIRLELKKNNGLYLSIIIHLYTVIAVKKYDIRKCTIIKIFIEMFESTVSIHREDIYICTAYFRCTSHRLYLQFSCGRYVCLVTYVNI